MDSEYLAKYYALERTHWWFIVREKILFSQLSRSLPQNKLLNILNVGIATGKTTEMLSHFGKVTSVEYDHTTCEFVRGKLNIEVTEASVVSLPFSNDSFDIVCAFDVLEHVEDDQLAIRELNRVCRTGGFMYVSCPAFSFLWSSHDLINHHFRRYTAASLRKLIQFGFNVQYVTYFNFILFIPIAVYRLLQHLISSKKVTSDFEEKGLLTGKVVSPLYKAIFSIEIFLLKHIKLPFGISLFARAVKEA